MSMGMLVGSYVFQRQRVEQMMKLAISQELRVVLKLILALIQAIKVGQKVSIKQVQEIKQAVAELSQQDALDLTHETIRRGGIEQAYRLAYALGWVSQQAPRNFSGLSGFAQIMTESVLREEERRNRNAVWLQSQPVQVLECFSHLREEKEPQPPMNATNRKTVRQLMDQVLCDLLGEDYVKNVAPPGLAHTDIVAASDQHEEFWEKLCRLGWERKTKSAEECADLSGGVDATAFISDEEYEALMAEARALPPIWKKQWLDKR